MTRVVHVQVRHLWIGEEAPDQCLQLGPGCDLRIDDVIPLVVRPHAQQAATLLIRDHIDGIEALCRGAPNEDRPAGGVRARAGLMPEGEEQHFFTRFGVLQTDAARRRIGSVDDTSFDATTPQLIVRRVLKLGKLVGGQAGDAVVHETSSRFIEVSSLCSVHPRSNPFLARESLATQLISRAGLLALSATRLGASLAARWRTAIVN